VTRGSKAGGQSHHQNAPDVPARDIQSEYVRHPSLPPPFTRPAEKRVGEYSKAGVGVAAKEQQFKLDDDF
jgi:hypothetical protein